MEPNSQSMLDTSNQDGRPLSEVYRLVAKRWVTADAAATLLEDAKSAVLAKMMTDRGDMPVSKAEMQVKASDDWLDYITKTVRARGAALTSQSATRVCPDAALRSGRAPTLLAVQR